MDGGKADIVSFLFHCKRFGVDPEGLFKPVSDIRAAGSSFKMQETFRNVIFFVDWYFFKLFPSVSTKV
jgi:hypothetical protein